MLMAMEMILGITLFRHDSRQGPPSSHRLPLIAGAGSFTTLLALRAEFALFNIIAASLPTYSSFSSSSTTPIASNASSAQAASMYSKSFRHHTDGHGHPPVYVEHRHPAC